MNLEQTLDYQRLNKIYNKLSKSNIRHSVCSKKTLLLKIEAFINEQRTTNNK